MKNKKETRGGKRPFSGRKKLTFVITNIFCEAIVMAVGGYMLDANNIVWKVIDGKWIGKRSVWTFDFRSCWLEDTTIYNVKSWWCGGKDADYTEIFYRDEM
jgi:hypothetical protein